MNRLNGKVVALAGAGGIGEGLALRYAAEGASVLIGDIDEQRASTLAVAISDSGGTASSARLDITDEDSVRAFVERATGACGRLDAFHANAAYFDPADLDAVTTPAAAYQRVMQVDAEGFLICTRHAIPALLAHGGGTMLYTSSGAAHSPLPVRVSYAMAKAAVHALARHVAVRWGKEGIRANVIAPGIIMHHELEKNAPFLREEGTKNTLTPYVGDPTDIASMATLLISDEGKFISGQIISVDGGATTRP